MQWRSSYIGFGSDGSGDESSTLPAAVETLRRLRCAWIRAMVHSGEYDSPDVLDDTLDAMLGSLR